MARRPYTMTEMKQIVDHLKENNLYGETKGRKMWMDFESTRKTNRTWQSLKETFLKRILPEIHNPYYKLTSEEIASFRVGYSMISAKRNKLNIQMSEGKKRTPPKKPETDGRGKDVKQTETKPNKNKDKKAGENTRVVLSPDILVLSSEDICENDKNVPSNSKNNITPNKNKKGLKEPITPVLQQILQDFDSESTHCSDEENGEIKKNNYKEHHNIANNKKNKSNSPKVAQKNTSKTVTKKLNKDVVENSFQLSDRRENDDNDSDETSNGDGVSKENFTDTDKNLNGKACLKTQSLFSQELLKDIDDDQNYKSGDTRITMAAHIKKSQVLHNFEYTNGDRLNTKDKASTSPDRLLRDSILDSDTSSDSDFASTPGEPSRRNPQNRRPSILCPAFEEHNHIRGCFKCKALISALKDDEVYWKSKYLIERKRSAAIAKLFDESDAKRNSKKMKYSSPQRIQQNDIIEIDNEDEDIQTKQNITNGQGDDLAIVKSEEKKDSDQKTVILKFVNGKQEISLEGVRQNIQPLLTEVVKMLKRDNNLNDGNKCIACATHTSAADSSNSVTDNKQVTPPSITVTPPTPALPHNHADTVTTVEIPEGIQKKDNTIENALMPKQIEKEEISTEIKENGIEKTLNKVPNKRGRKPKSIAEPALEPPPGVTVDENINKMEDIVNVTRRGRRSAKSLYATINANETIAPQKPITSVAIPASSFEEDSDVRYKFPSPEPTGTELVSAKNKKPKAKLNNRNFKKSRKNRSKFKKQ